VQNQVHSPHTRNISVSSIQPREAHANVADSTSLSPNPNFMVQKTKVTASAVVPPLTGFYRLPEGLHDIQDLDTCEDRLSVITHTDTNKPLPTLPQDRDLSDWRVSPSVRTDVEETHTLKDNLCPAAQVLEGISELLQPLRSDKKVSNRTSAQLNSMLK
jgi:hypothetical protein